MTNGHHIMTLEQRIIKDINNKMANSHHIIKSGHCIMTFDHHVRIIRQCIIIDSRRIIANCHHILTNCHHILTKCHHIILIEQHILQREHPLFMDPQHINVLLMLRQSWRSIAGCGPWCLGYCKLLPSARATVRSHAVP